MSLTDLSRSTASIAPVALAPPVVRGSYVDPAFGFVVRRLTECAVTPDAASGGLLKSITPEYSSVSPWNCDGSYLLLVHQSYFGLYGADGQFIRSLPFMVNASSEPRWSRTDPNAFYFIVENTLVAYDIDEWLATEVRKFSEYDKISGKGESDISADGTSMVLIGNERDVFVYNLRTGEKRIILDAAGAAIESLYITGDNDVLVSSAAGMSLYGEDSLSAKGWGHLVAPVNAHKDICDDADGNPTLVWCCSADASMNCNGIVATRLRDGRRTVLLTLDWSLALHVSCPDAAGFAIISTEQAPDGPSVPYANEILRVALDGGGVTRLAHHRSRIDGYESQPKVVCSRDGSRVAWGSNFGGPSMDTYLISIADDSPHRPRPHRPPGERKPGKRRGGA